MKDGTPWADHPSWELVAEASAATGRDVEYLLLHADAEELCRIIASIQKTIKGGNAAHS